MSSSKQEHIRHLLEMYDNVEKEYLDGEIDCEEKELRQEEIMDTLRVIQP